MGASSVGPFDMPLHKGGSSAPLPATWIAAEYANLASRAQYVSIGAAQTK